MTETDLDRATEALAARIEILLKDNYALTRSLDGERDENARLLAAVGRVEGENAALREALDASRALAGRVDGLADQVARLAAALQQVPPVGGSPGPVAVRGGRDEAAEQLHAILTSRSWRMTRPIRGLGRAMKRLRS